MPTIKLTKVQAKELSMGLALYIAEINCIDDKDYRKRTKILQRVLDKLPTVEIEETPLFNSLDEWLKLKEKNEKRFMKASMMQNKKKDINEIDPPFKIKSGYY